MDIFESYSNDDYLKAPITWQLLYRMVSVIDENQSRIMFDKPVAKTAGGKIIHNTRSYRRGGGSNVTTRVTSLPDNVYKAWNYFARNTQAINDYLRKGRATGAAKGVFVYMKAGGDSVKRRRTFFNSPYYTHFITQITEFTVNLTTRAKPSDRIKVSLMGLGIKMEGQEFLVNIIRGQDSIDVIHSFNRDKWPELRELVKAIQ